MQTKIPKINYYKYCIGTIVVFGLVYGFSGENRNILATTVVLIGSVLNHLMLYRGGILLLGMKHTNNKNLKALLYFGGKSLILAVALYLSFKIDSRLVLYSVFQYIFQLIILVLSIKRY